MRLLNTRGCLLALLWLLLFVPLAAQSGSDSAGSGGDTGGSTATSGSSTRSTEAAQDESLAQLLKPSSLSVGLLPTLDGFLDGKLGWNFRWNSWLSSGLQAWYTGSSEAVDESDETTVLSAKAFSKEYRGSLNLLELFFAFPSPKGGGIALEAAVACSYEGLDESLSGYRKTGTETVYFNQDSFKHTLLPAAKLSLLGASGGSGKPRLNSTLSGAFMPWVALYESGSKIYSSYEDAIPFELYNTGMAWQAAFEIRSAGSRFLDFGLSASVLSIFGDFASTQAVITGNWLTTINTYVPYQTYRIEAQLDIAVPALQNLIKLIPAVSVAYEHNLESFDSLPFTGRGVWKFGFTVSSR